MTYDLKKNVKKISSFQPFVEEIESNPERCKIKILTKWKSNLTLNKDGPELAKKWGTSINFHKTIPNDISDWGQEQ